MLLYPRHHRVEVGVSCAEAPRQEISAPLGDRLSVNDDVELPFCSRFEQRLNAELVFDHGHETRDLGAIVLSGGAVNDLDFHVRVCAFEQFHDYTETLTRIWLRRR